MSDFIIFALAAVCGYLAGSINPAVIASKLFYLTSVRMMMANLAGLIIKTLPLVIVLFAPKVLNPQTGEMEPVYNTPEAGGAWFITMSIFALVGLVLLLVTFFESKERIVMDKS